MPHWLRLILQTTLTACVVVALGIAVDPSTLYDTLKRARGVWVGLAVLLLPVNLFLDGWVWGRLLDTVDDDFPPRQIGRAVLSGLSLGFWTPARLGEYAGRAFSFPTADRWTISLSVFAQRMLDMAAGVGIGLGFLLGALLTERLPPTSTWLTVAAVGLVTVGVLSTLILFPTRIRWLTNMLEDWGEGLHARTAFLQRLTLRHGIDVVGGTVARYLVFTGQFVCLALALDPTAPLALLSTAVGLTFYAKYLIPSLTLLDLGIREGGAVLFFQLLDLSPAVGLSASLLLFSLNVLLPALLGVPFLGSLSFSQSSPNATASPKPVADS